MELGDLMLLLERLWVVIFSEMFILFELIMLLDIFAALILSFISNSLAFIF